VESIEGSGSTFRFEIAAPASAAPVETPNLVTYIDDDRPAMILVVDDVEVNRELVRAMLTPLGHECVEASSGAEAVALCGQSTFDLILMDLQMPGMDGLAATRAIRALGPVQEATPILALSANVLEKHLAAAREAGMDDHIAKPIRAAELVTKIHYWLDAGRSATQEPVAAVA
jgi:CheY-like chemotaxis protein